MGNWLGAATGDESGGIVLLAATASPCATADASISRIPAPADAGEGGEFDVAGIPGASSYAVAYFSANFNSPILLLAGFDLDRSHLFAVQVEQPIRLLATPPRLHRK